VNVEHAVRSPSSNDTSKRVNRKYDIDIYIHIVTLQSTSDNKKEDIFNNFYLQETDQSKKQPKI